ncbi:MAG: class I SAM-dependent methyltransferase [Stappiaceae bacterium]
MKEPVPHAPKKDDNSGDGKDDITDQTDSGLEDAISQALEQAMPASDEAWPEGLDVGLAGALEVELSGSQDTEPVEAAEGSEQSSPSESIAGGDQPSQGEDNAYPEVDLDAAALEAALASSLEAGLGLDAAQEGAPAPAGGSARESGFFNRRKAAAQKLLQDQSIRSGDMGKHNAWFQAAYEGAGGDEAAVPWADLRPKPELLRWLTENPGEGRMAIDVGCGLGDNADALAQAGWKVTAFDISKDAISWAKKRFPDSAVNFEAANLMKPPPLWGGAFDLVFECYNLQAFAPGDLRGKAIEAVSRLVRPGGILFVYSLLGKDSDDLDGGPPWPLTLSDLDAFKRHGLEIDIQRPGVHIESSGMAPFVTALFNKPAR